jgi:3-oxoacyl-[acyl-carrier protein] reductase
VQFDGMIVLVTGGASGIGLGCVRALLGRGAHVCAADLRKNELAVVETRLLDEGAFPRQNLLAVAANVNDEGEVEALFGRIESQWRSVDALVNNAGVSGGRLRLGEISPEMWDRMMVDNLRGMYLCCARALPAMTRKRWGRIVNMTSIAAVSGKGFASPHYSAAKGGMVGFTKRLAVEAAPHNVAVNCVAPGLISDTGFTAAVRGELLERYLAGIPANRPGTVEEVAELVAFLLSPACGFIIGQTIAIDGGASS